MQSWQLQEAKARFSEFLDAAIEKGPQMVTRRGVEAAVLVPIEEWRRLQQNKKPDIKELLLAGPKFENLVPDRHRRRRRPPVEFE
ncbi:MAG TPA: type II toxin-antitoxin system Phd/YefM family antitoxin [Candidatus Solibacter sp.]|nr:type II toxin-antitoxin system Phd/YefM family antitoxin [Candidatus Solibacter sp.]